MLLLLLAAVLFALFVGTLAFVTGPVGLGMAAAITVWLAAYAAHSLLRARIRARMRARTRIPAWRSAATVVTGAGAGAVGVAAAGAGARAGVAVPAVAEVARRA